MTGWSHEDWEPRTIIAPDHVTRAEPPRVRGLLYDRRRHVLFGETEAAKTLIALTLALEFVRATPADGEWLSSVAYIDFENGTEAISLMLAELGATAKEVERVFLFHPTAVPSMQDVYCISVEIGCGLVIIDAGVGACAVSGLDDNDRKDIERMASMWVRPFWESGSATVVIDHVTKSSEGRGRWPIGSERKLSQADTGLYVDTITPVSRGSSGIYKFVSAKDRGGYLKRGTTVAEIHLSSDPSTHRISWEFRKPSTTNAYEHWRPTLLMQRVSEYLAAHPEGASRNEIEKNVKGKSNDHKRQAIDELVCLGNATEEAGPRGARIVKHLSSFTSPDLAPTSPGEVTTTSPTSPAPTGARREARLTASTANTTSPEPRAASRWTSRDRLG